MTGSAKGSDRQTSTHWGVYRAQVDGGRLVGLTPSPDDPDPSPIGSSMVGAVDGDLRIAGPMIRSGWLEHGPGVHTEGRASDPYVRVSWDRALDIVAAEISRVRGTHGNESIYAGSYGWASAGRFHHAQSQIHRFMALGGGYTASVNSYSTAAAQVIVPHVLGMSWMELGASLTSWPVIAEHTDLFVMFGGMATRNSQVGSGGMGRHVLREWLAACRERGVEFVNVGPIADDSPDGLTAEWLSIRANTDVAVMLGIAHTLITEGLVDHAFLERYTVGAERLIAYILGDADGVIRDAAWAASVADCDAGRIRDLARRMASRRSMVTSSWSVQRGDHGEQPYWMTIALAALLGQIGLPGGGFGLGYGTVNGAGHPIRRVPLPRFPIPPNPVSSSIPVARIADMLLHPGADLEFNGTTSTLPDIRLVYWAGGNPFHHHQDLNRFLGAWRRPETTVVHESWWTATARHADIVLPVTTTLEREDIGAAANDDYLVAMHRVIEPVGEARDDFDIFAALAARLGFGDAFSERRTAEGWIRSMYEEFRVAAAERSVDAPSFDGFWSRGSFRLPPPEAPGVLLASFRSDPVRHRLGTPSGRIELFSDEIEGFGYDDCPGHPVWLEPAEWAGGDLAARFPLHLLSSQPSTRLHSQYDHGSVSRASKIVGREPLRMGPADAAARGIDDGDVVRVFNDRGAFLAGVRISDRLRRGVVQIATGAWYDPLEPGVIGSLEKHGNPNVVTLDKGTSRLAQGPSAQTTLVEVERWRGPLPPVTAFIPPEILEEEATRT